MRILIIPEDPTLDQFILKPIVQRIFADLGKAVQVEVLFDPHLTGVDEALEATTVRDIIEENPMVDLFLLMVDRDCDRLGNTNKASARMTEHSGRLIACLAVEEVEVWMLALYRNELGHSWQPVRSHCVPKETYADPFLDAKGWIDKVGKGRKHAMRTLGARWKGLLSICPEIEELKRFISIWLELAR